MGGEHERVPAVGGAVIGQGVEIEDLTEPEAHVNDRDEVERLEHVDLVRADLDAPGVRRAAAISWS